MASTSLRRVGGSMMLAIPQALLSVLQIGAGAVVGLGIDNGRLVAEPQSRPRYTLAALLSASDYPQPHPPEERDWVDAPPAGCEVV